LLCGQFRLWSCDLTLPSRKEDFQSNNLFPQRLKPCSFPIFDVQAEARTLLRFKCDCPAPPQVVVDSAMRFGYSEILARCCAWGLCVGPPSRVSIEGVSHKSPGLGRSIFLRKLAGTGQRLPDFQIYVRVGADPDQSEPFRGSTPAILTRTGLFGSGWNETRALCMGEKHFVWVFVEILATACVLPADFLRQASRGQESDGYLCSERQGH